LERLVDGTDALRNHALFSAIDGMAETGDGAVVVKRADVPSRMSSPGARAFELGKELLELRIRAQILQIVVGHYAIGILIPAIDGFL
jgi:hypothetical protein